MKSINLTEKNCLICIYIFKFNHQLSYKVLNNYYIFVLFNYKKYLFATRVILTRIEIETAFFTKH